MSVLIGMGSTAVFGRRALEPMRRIIGATQRVAAGDITVRLERGGLPEIDDLSASFNKMVSELQSIETLRSDFVSDFSHEFKTPIVSIRGYAKLLQDDEITEEERQEYIDIIIRESERLTKLASNILDLSKLENTEILSNQEVFRLDETIRKGVVLLEPEWSKKNISMDLRLDPVHLTGDSELLQQVWVNLVDNAIKFSPAGGVIQIELTKRADGCVTRIADNGCGMDERTLSHAFDKFFQGDRSRSGAGNGLGLAMVKRIVEMNGGTIHAKSEPGKGSEFTITFFENGEGAVS